MLAAGRATENLRAGDHRAWRRGAHRDRADWLDTISPTEKVAHSERRHKNRIRTSHKNRLSRSSVTVMECFDISQSLVSHALPSATDDTPRPLGVDISYKWGMLTRQPTNNRYPAGREAGMDRYTCWEYHPCLAWSDMLATAMSARRSGGDIGTGCQRRRKVPAQPSHALLSQMTNTCECTPTQLPVVIQLLRGRQPPLPAGGTSPSRTNRCRRR